MKAKKAKQAIVFEDIPNIGPSIAKDFKLIGLKSPKDLKGSNAFILYKKLCSKTKTRHDPCVLDTFMAAVDFMNGSKARPWWSFTSQRKKKFPNI